MCAQIVNFATYRHICDRLKLIARTKQKTKTKKGGGNKVNILPFINIGYLKEQKLIRQGPPVTSFIYYKYIGLHLRLKLRPLVKLA